jgi:hypothetical protein
MKRELIELKLFDEAGDRVERLSIRFLRSNIAQSPYSLVFSFTDVAHDAFRTVCRKTIIRSCCSGTGRLPFLF